MLNLTPPKRGAPAAIKTSSHQHPTFIQASHSAARTTHCHGGSWRKCHAGRIQDPWRLRNIASVWTDGQAHGPWKKTGFAVAVCKTWWIVAEGSLYSSRCILYVFFCQDTRYSNDLLYHQSHQKRWYAWKASTKDSTLGYLQRARGWSANITPGRLLPHHWLPKINCQKKIILYLIPPWHKSVITHNVTYQHHTNTKLVLNLLISDN